MPVVKKLNNSIQENKGNKLNLLLLEDHPLVANLEVRSLIHAGFQVKLAKTIEEMTNILNHEKMDIVIMDFLFQKGKGIKEIKNAKLKSLNPRTRFVVSSVQCQEEIKESAYANQADLFIIKPLPRTSLIQEIKKLAKQEFRKSIRTRCNIAFIVKIKDNTFHTFAIDISSEGSHLLDKDNKINPYVGMEFSFEFMLPKTPEFIKAKGTVVRITEEGFGLKFTNISKTDKSKIEHYISGNSIEVKSIHYYL